MKIKLDGKKHRVLVKELVETRTCVGVFSVSNYEYRETKIRKWKNGISTEKVKQCYVFKGGTELIDNFVRFINELIDGGRLEIKTNADFKILKLEVFGKSTIAAHTSNSAGFITFTIKDFLSAYKFYPC